MAKLFSLSGVERGAYWLAAYIAQATATSKRFYLRDAALSS
jgi:hypothetical protein